MLSAIVEQSTIAIDAVEVVDIIDTIGDANGSIGDSYRYDRL